LPKGQCGGSIRETDPAHTLLMGSSRAKVKRAALCYLRKRKAVEHARRRIETAWLTQLRVARIFTRLQVGRDRCAQRDPKRSTRSRTLLEAAPRRSEKP
jgi:hypothetical protein